MIDNIHSLLESISNIIKSGRHILFNILNNDDIPLIIRADILSEAKELSYTGIRNDIPLDIIPDDLLNRLSFNLRDVINLIADGTDCYDLLEFMVKNGFTSIDMLEYE